jgi:hypothetical protein
LIYTARTLGRLLSERMTLVIISIHFTTSWTSIIVLSACAAIRSPCHLKMSQNHYLPLFCFDFL